MNHILPVYRTRWHSELHAQTKAQPSSLPQMMEKDERSARALQLTEHVIALNAANYTVWAYRRAIVDALGRKVAPSAEP